MARSFRKTPVTGMTGSRSEKDDKRIWHRRLRRRTRCVLRQIEVDPERVETVSVPEIRDVSNVWDFNKDGKHYRKPGYSRFASIFFRPLPPWPPEPSGVLVTTRRGFRKFFPAFWNTHTAREIYRYWGK